MIIEIISWIAFVMGVAGLWLSGKHRNGWLLNALAFFPWVIVGIATGVWAIVLNTTVFAIVSLRNWWIWNKAHPGE